MILHDWQSDLIEMFVGSNEYVLKELKKMILMSKSDASSDEVSKFSKLNEKIWNIVVDKMRW